jgi:hypothetical protein
VSRRHHLQSRLRRRPIRNRKQPVRSVATQTADALQPVLLGSLPCPPSGCGSASRRQTNSISTVFLLSEPINANHSGAVPRVSGSGAPSLGTWQLETRCVAPRRAPETATSTTREMQKHQRNEIELRVDNCLSYLIQLPLAIILRRTFVLPKECSDRCFPFGYLRNKFNCSDDVQKGADRMESITVIASLIICPFLPLFFSFAG